VRFIQDLNEFAEIPESHTNHGNSSHYGNSSFHLIHASNVKWWGSSDLRSGVPTHEWFASLLASVAHVFAALQT
jgi:hypothetical protein